MWTPYLLQRGTLVVKMIYILKNVFHTRLIIRNPLCSCPSPNFEDRELDGRINSAFESNESFTQIIQEERNISFLVYL